MRRLLRVFAPAAPARRCSFASSSFAGSSGGRRRAAANWERAFFGRVHYEAGMREKYRAAVGEEGAGKSHREIFPDWPEDDEAPPHEFRRLPDDMKRRYIANRLAAGERRIVSCVDYGSLVMMQHLNLGERMINEAERLLVECGWMNELLAEKIGAVRECAVKVKFEFDLD